MAVTARIALEEEQGVPVVRFLERHLLDDRAVRESADQIVAALPPDGPSYLIIDFSGVTMVSSALLGRLVLLQRRADTTGGRLRLCEMTPSVRAVLKTTNLDRVLTVVRDRLEAREAFGSLR